MSAAHPLQLAGRVSSVVIAHPAFHRALDLAKTCVERGEHRETPPGLLVIGPSGCGKTTLARVLEDTFPPTTTAEAAEMPVLIVTTPAGPTIKGLVEAILASLGVKLPWRFTTEELVQELLRWLETRKVRVIVIDEIQHFVESSSRTMGIVTDFLKTLIDRAGLPIILLGLETSRKLLASNEQLRRRFTSMATLEAFRFETAADKAVFRDFVVAILRTAGFEQVVKETADLDWRFHCASGGLPCHVVGITAAAAELLRGKRKEASLDDLARAFRDVVWERGSGALNPFSETWSKRPLIRAGEPFAYLGKAGVE